MGRWYTPVFLISTDSRCSNLPGPCLDTFFYPDRTRCSVSPGCAIHPGPRLLHPVLHPSALTWGRLASLCSVPCLSATPEVDTGPVPISSPPFPLSIWRCISNLLATQSRINFTAPIMMLEKQSDLASPCPSVLRLWGRYACLCLKERNQQRCLTCAIVAIRSFQHGSNMLKGMPPLLSSEVIDKLTKLGSG